MSSDALIHLLENPTNNTRVLTWKDIAEEKWSEKSKNCQCRPGKGSILDRCRLTNDNCEIGLCPFVYWE